MSRRSASLRRGQPHVPVPLPDVPNACACGRRTDLPNDMHIDEYPATEPAVRTEEARRYGDYEGDE